MTELRTLKDILEMNGVDYESGDWTNAGDTLIDLRAEAVKWIKGLEKDGIKENVNVAGWIKYFFNITEEELAK